MAEGAAAKEAALPERAGGVLVHNAFGAEVGMSSKVGNLRGTSYSAMGSCSSGCRAEMRDPRRTGWFGGGKDSLKSLSCENVTTSSLSPLCH